MAGDVGGTNVRLAVFTWDGSKLTPIIEKSYETASYGSMEEILIDVPRWAGEDRIQSVCLGVAGPVKGGRVTLTNVGGWTLTEESISDRIESHPEVTLVNDLEANAFGLGALDPESDLKIVLPGNGGIRPRQNAALIAAGTGLGEAGLIWDGRTHHPNACEGGHTDFAPGEFEFGTELECYLRRKQWEQDSPSGAHISWERVVSGSALPHIYEFFCEIRPEESSPILTDKIREPGANVGMLIDRGARNGDRCCLRTVELFGTYYGAEAGNLALKLGATGGVYIGGGIAPKNWDLIGQAFVAGFLSKGRMSHLLRETPVELITNTNAALLGAAYVAARGKINGIPLP